MLSDPNLCRGKPKMPVHRIVGALLLQYCLIAAQTNKFDISMINPGITSSNLCAAHFFGMSTGYVAGGRGTVLFTSDSCKSWRECRTPKLQPVFTLFFHDVQHGWAAGGAEGQPYLIRTADSGYTWTEYALAVPKGATIRKIFFRNLTEGWITGGTSSQEGFVCRTTDGGSTWMNRSPDGLQIPYNNITDILVVDSATVIVCGHHGYLARSSDNGLNWQRIEWKSSAPDSLVQGPLEQFLQVSGTVIYCKGNEDLLRSNDNGKTWSDVLFRGHGNIQPGGFFFHSVDSGFLLRGFGENATRYTTVDGGKTWNTIRDTVGEVTGPILFPGNGTLGYMVGMRSEIYRISLMGERKVQLNSGHTLGTPTVDFCEGRAGCIGGEKPLGLRTTIDGGRTWRIIDSSADYTGVILWDSSTFALSNGTVSTDGGKSWHTASDGLGKYRKFYKTARNDAVYFSQIIEGGIGSRLFKTKDWFTTSTECMLPPDAGTFFFLCADTGWAAQKKLYQTTDGGTSWKEVGPIGGITGAKCLFFTDNLHGWAGGVLDGNGRPTTVMRTSDGGKTWLPQVEMQYLPDSLYPPNAPVKGRLPIQICASDPQEAWFIDGFYCVFHTGDSGATWQQIRLPPKCEGAYLEGTAAVAGNGSLFCTGENGMVLQITAASGNRLRAGIRKTMALPGKNTGTVHLPLSAPGRGHFMYYELNGVRIKPPENGSHVKRFRRPVVAKQVPMPQ